MSNTEEFATGTPPKNDPVEAKPKAKTKRKAKPAPKPKLGRKFKGRPGGDQKAYCTKCDWKGKGSQTVMTGATKSCPRCFAAATV